MVDRALQYSTLVREHESLKSKIGNGKEINIIGKSLPMRQLFELIQRVAKVNSNVLIEGESGTGKELVAREIHRLSSRSSKPFVAINCSAIPNQLLESELFGHVKGSFTGAINDKKGLFEEADGGTLFLDEIGDMDFELQAKILRAIQEKRIKRVGGSQEKEFDVRIVCATHKNLKDEVKKGTFREDLYFRLSVIPVEIPPLRKRVEDIPLLINYFLKKASAENDLPLKQLEPMVLQELLDRDWEGNVRELENTIERLVVLSDSKVIKLNSIQKSDLPEATQILHEAMSHWPTLEELEKKYIKMVLEENSS